MKRNSLEFFCIVMVVGFMAVIYFGNMLIPDSGSVSKDIERWEEQARFERFVSEMGPIEIIERETDERGLTSIVYVTALNDTVGLDFLTAEEYKQITHVNNPK